ncbi:hypothetical protein EalM132_00070 [Exiguobacterium phage vB_EalM-132]|nr:hypothetical protein EalM132_00070 [Exiguobacterium phage vB_EalM-132]
MSLGNGQSQDHAGFMVPRADFKPEAFDTLVLQKGYRVLWEQGTFCSCYQESGQPDYNCPVCSGKGYIYVNPTEIRVLVTSINGHKEQNKLGLHEAGSAYLTPTSKDNVGYRDRFLFMDFTMKYSEVLERGAGDTDRLRYEAIDVIYSHKLGEPLLRGVHYELVNRNRAIQWKPDAPIYEGEKYGILYNTRPVYIAINPVHELRGTYTKYKGRGEELFVKLPNQYQIKREDFIEQGYAYEV